MLQKAHQKAAYQQEALQKKARPVLGRVNKQMRLEVPESGQKQNKLGAEGLAL